ncbi:hypothetical protein H920_13316 [Fukomys damarensis]|uniref:Uncharacterized protein n=1 Tax=Fukomys damarensis TaxID=885580 RepID=A0A091D471_FUKDA|nr:hypothetical protein H920_13316 [Fukomys damarensis]
MQDSGPICVNKHAALQPSDLIQWSPHYEEPFKRVSQGFCNWTTKDSKIASSSRSLCEGTKEELPLSWRTEQLFKAEKWGGRKAAKWEKLAGAVSPEQLRLELPGSTARSSTAERLLRTVGIYWSDPCGPWLTNAAFSGITERHISLTSRQHFC